MPCNNTIEFGAKLPLVHLHYLIDIPYVLSYYYDNEVKYFDWDKEKNKILTKERGISFEEIKMAVEEGKTLDTHNHPNQKRYPGQKIMVVEIENYAYLVPYVRDGEKFFLKTIIPSRKATKKYLRGKL